MKAWKGVTGVLGAGATVLTFGDDKDKVCRGVTGVLGEAEAGCERTKGVLKYVVGVKGTGIKVDEAVEVVEVEVGTGSDVEDGRAGIGNLEETWLKTMNLQGWQTSKVCRHLQSSSSFSHISFENVLP